MFLIIWGIILVDVYKRQIYNRVEAAKKKIAENNALIQNTLQPNLDTATNNYNAFKPEYDETVRQMNERLSLSLIHILTV